MRRVSVLSLLALVLALGAACTNKKSVNPLANVGSKQPDKVLFDRAMDAMKHNRFDVARMTLADADQHLSGFGIHRARQAGGGRLMVRRGRFHRDAAS